MGVRKKVRTSENSNVKVARTVYMYILIVGALALMSTDAFTFDVIARKGVTWPSVILFWLTIAMWSGAFYLFDRSRRTSGWFSVLMSVIFLVGVAYPFYTLSDPRLLVIRVAMGVVVLFAVDYLIRSIDKSMDEFKDRSDHIERVKRDYRKRGVNNFTRLRNTPYPPRTRSDSFEGGYDPERWPDDRYGKDEEVSDSLILQEFAAMSATDENSELQRILDEMIAKDLAKAKEAGRLTERMKKVRDRRKFRRRTIRLYADEIDGYGRKDDRVELDDVKDDLDQEE